ncbi:MAG TPA: hypothetical protein VK539_28835 [Myxococcaceae bacterium]|nr:hypothetical protein [Myxococcaceae bacterium]
MPGALCLPALQPANTKLAHATTTWRALNFPRHPIPGSLSSGSPAAGAYRSPPCRTAQVPYGFLPALEN